MTFEGPLGLAVGREDPMTAEMIRAVAAACAGHGIPVRFVSSPAEADGVRTILGIGYPHAYPALFSRPARTRRIAWLGEPLPPAGSTGAVARLFRELPSGRLVDAVGSVITMGDRRPRPGRVVAWRERAAWEREWRTSLRAHLRAAALGTELVATSADRAATLAHFGVAARVVPFGYHPTLAGPPVDPATGDRDIDVLAVGRDASGVPTRRCRIVQAFEHAARGRLRVVSVEAGLYGDERAALFRRAKIVLQVHRTPGNFAGIRELLAGAAGAAVLSEPMTAAEPFVPGVHFVEADPDRLAETAVELVADEPRRVRIAGALQALLAGELTMERSVERVLSAP